MHISSLLRMEWFKENYLSRYKSKKIRILDIGSFSVNGNYKCIFNEINWEYYGLDVEKGPNVDIVVSDSYNWSDVRSNSFDVVISGQAFEHIEFFWLTMKEIDRVLKTNGLCCIIAPSSGPEHRYPVDCYRFHEDGMKALAKYVGFEILHVSSAKNQDNPEFNDSECEWKDSMLIARKPIDQNNDGIYSEMQKLYEKIQLQNQVISNYENSRYWKIIKPIRSILDFIKKIIK